MKKRENNYYFDNKLQFMMDKAYLITLPKILIIVIAPQHQHIMSGSECLDILERYNDTWYVCSPALEGCPWIKQKCLIWKVKVRNLIQMHISHVKYCTNAWGYIQAINHWWSALTFSIFLYWQNVVEDQNLSLI